MDPDTFFNSFIYQANRMVYLRRKEYEPSNYFISKFGDIVVDLANITVEAFTQKQEFSNREYEKEDEYTKQVEEKETERVKEIIDNFTEKERNNLMDYLSNLVNEEKDHAAKNIKKKMK